MAAAWARDGDIDMDLDDLDDQDDGFCCRLAIKTLRASKLIIELILRFVGPIFVLIALTLTMGSLYVFFRAILPYHLPSFWSPYAVFHLALCAFLGQGWIFNYLMCIFTPPGAPAQTVPLPPFLHLPASTSKFQQHKF